jgi:hypothetical protein
MSDLISTHEGGIRALLAIEEAAIKIFIFIVGNTEDGKIYKVDAIEYEQKLWLVPRWLDAPARGVTMPARLIRMDTLPYQKMTHSSYGADFVLNVPVPKVLLGPTTPQEAVPDFEVRELPEVEIPLAEKNRQSCTNKC